MRVPCSRCGGPKGPGPGRRVCEDCRTADQSGLCQRCGRPKPPGRGLRLCTDCPRVGRQKGHVSPCRKCGSTEPKSVRGRRLCDECQKVETEAAAIRKRARKSLHRKPCGRCGGVKGPGLRRRLCDACRREDSGLGPRACNTCGKKIVVGKHKKVCADCKRETLARRRARERQRSAEYRARNLPAAKARKVRYERANRARKAEAQRLRHNLAREGQSAGPLRDSDARRMPRLPAGPLAAALDHIIARESSGNPYDDLPRYDRDGRATAVCERVEISPRNLLAWRIGERLEVHFDVADRILTRTDLTWWDVWNAETVTDPASLARIEELFEGTGRIAA